MVRLLGPESGWSRRGPETAARVRSTTAIPVTLLCHHMTPELVPQAGSWKLELEPLSVTGRDRDVTRSTLISLQILLFPLHHCELHEWELELGAGAAEFHMDVT